MCIRDRHRRPPPLEGCATPEGVRHPFRGAPPLGARRPSVQSPWEASARAPQAPGRSPRGPISPVAPLKGCGTPSRVRHPFRGAAPLEGRRTPDAAPQGVRAAACGKPLQSSSGSRGSAGRGFLFVVSLFFVVFCVMGKSNFAGSCFLEVRGDPPPLFSFFRSVLRSRTQRRVRAAPRARVAYQMMIVAV